MRSSSGGTCLAKIHPPLSMYGDPRLHDNGETDLITKPRHW